MRPRIIIITTLICSSMAYAGEQITTKDLIANQIEERENLISACKKDKEVVSLLNDQVNDFYQLRARLNNFSKQKSGTEIYFSIPLFFVWYYISIALNYFVVV